ncbi:hypothetical protein P7K49_019190, partial [Saguinus oedipus]
VWPAAGRRSGWGAGARGAGRRRREMLASAQLGRARLGSARRLGPLRLCLPLLPEARTV